jgi:hypothetical protein
MAPTSHESEPPGIPGRFRPLVVRFVLKHVGVRRLEEHDGPVRHVRVNGVDLEYVEEGTGIPVVFSQGGSSDLRYWEPQRKVFGARYRFVAYSRRFHGSGARPAHGDDSVDAHKNDLLAIMRRLKAGPVTSSASPRRSRFAPRWTNTAWFAV